MAREYHDRTAHSYSSVRQSGHSLDWETKPFLYKVYPDLPVVELPREFPPPTRDTLEALGSFHGAGGSLNIENLTALCFYAAGVTKTKHYPGGEEMHFRAAPSTGALYQTEVYAVTGELPGLPAGVYHFCPGDFVLRRLRDGDFRNELAEAAADPDVERAPATLVLSAIFWRNTWKYQARGYRHCYWDSGTMLANLFATAAAFGIPARLLTSFVDHRVDRLIGIDGEKEGSLELVTLGPLSEAAGASPPVEPIAPKIIPLSQSEMEYPDLREIHVASFLADAEAVRSWREGPAVDHPPPPADLVPLTPLSGASGLPLADTIIRRASTRQFSGNSISRSELATVLHHATRGIPADYLPRPGSRLVDLYLIVNAVEGVAPGAYCYWPEAGGLELLRSGDFRGEAGYLCLDQSLGSDASAVIFFLADLGGILARFGNRGYRLANLEAGILGGRAYLGAYALGFGASGLTFYDGDVVRFFSPHADGKDAIFVTALGRSVKGAPSTVVPLQIGKK